MASVLNAPFPAEDPVVDYRSAELAFKSLFDFECLGIQRGMVSNLEEKVIEQFKNSITIKIIPWKTNGLSNVTNNLHICKAIARKVSIKNGDLDCKYLEFLKSRNSWVS